MTVNKIAYEIIDGNNMKQVLDGLLKTAKVTLWYLFVISPVRIIVGIIIRNNNNKIDFLFPVPHKNCYNELIKKLETIAEILRLRRNNFYKFLLERKVLTNFITFLSIFFSERNNNEKKVIKIVIN